MPAKTIAVIGGGICTDEIRDLAFAVGRGIALKGATLICGGRDGVMGAAAEGARSANGHTVGILPGYNRAEANPHIEFAIATGMGHARNAIVVASADAIIALAGEGGTMSEIGLALAIGRPVVALRSWRSIEKIGHADDVDTAVRLALET